MMKLETNRREFIQTAAIAVGSIFLPAGVRAGNAPRYWFIENSTGKEWAISDPVSWCLQNAHQPILERARDGLLNLTELDNDRIIRLVTRRCHLMLIDIHAENVVLHFWRQNEQADLRPFFKTHGLARKEIHVIAFNRKKEIKASQTGDDFLFGNRLSSDWPVELYQTKWERRNEQESDDWTASPKSRSGFAWKEVEPNLIPWIALKSAWRRNADRCQNCEQPTIVTNFGRPWIGMFQRLPIIEHVCPRCSRSFERRLSEPEQWMLTNLDADVLPAFVMMWNHRAKWDCALSS